MQIEVIHICFSSWVRLATASFKFLMLRMIWQLWAYITKSTFLLHSRVDGHQFQSALEFSYKRSQNPPYYFYFAFNTMKFKVSKENLSSLNACESIGNNVCSPCYREAAEYSVHFKSSSVMILTVDRKMIEPINHASLCLYVARAFFCLRKQNQQCWLFKK